MGYISSQEVRRAGGVIVLWEKIIEILMLENSFVIFLFISKLQEQPGFIFQKKKKKDSAWNSNYSRVTVAQMAKCCHSSKHLTVSPHNENSGQCYQHQMYLGNLSEGLGVSSAA